MILVPVLGQMPGGLCVPVDGLQHVEGLGGVAFDREDIGGGLRDQGRGLARGVQRVHRDDMSRDVAPLQQVLGGRDLAAFIMDVEHRKRRTGCMIGARDRLRVPRAVAVGGTHAFAIGGECFCERTTRACPVMDDILKGFWINGLEHAVNGGLGHRNVLSRFRVAPGTDGREWRLGEGAGEFRGGNAPFHVGEVGEDMDREDAGHRVLATLCPTTFGDIYQLLVCRFAEVRFVKALSTGDL